MKKYKLELQKHPDKDFRVLAESNDLEQIMLRFTERVENTESAGTIWVMRYEAECHGVPMVSYHWTTGISL